MVFPYHAYGTLQDLLNNNGGQFNEDVARFYSAQIILMVDHLKENNIAHRDIKPENLMVEKDGYLRLIDFGLATRLKNGLKSFSGTPEYIAPEVLQEKTWSARYLDMWSWGCLTYKLMYGVTPFEGPDATSVFLNTLTSPIRFPRTKQNISDDAKNLISKVLERKYDARPSMEEIKAHPFFANKIDWENLKNLKIPSPILPTDQTPKSLTFIPSSKVSDMFNSI